MTVSSAHPRRLREAGSAVPDTLTRARVLHDWAQASPIQIWELSDQAGLTSDGAGAVEELMFERIIHWRELSPDVPIEAVHEHALEAKALSEALANLWDRGHRLGPSMRRLVRRVALNRCRRGSQFLPSLVGAMRYCLVLGPFRLTRRDLARIVEPVPNYQLGYPIWTWVMLMHHPKITAKLRARAAHWLRTPLAED